jgi:hypothetical protein
MAKQGVVAKAKTTVAKAAQKVATTLQPPEEVINRPDMPESPVPDVDPLDDLKRALKWETDVLSDKSKRSWAAMKQRLLEDLRERKVSEELIQKVDALPTKILLGKKNTGVLRLGKTVGERNALFDSVETAKAAVHGLKRETLKQGYDELLKVLKQSGVPEEILSEVRKVSPTTLLSYRPSEVLQVLQTRGQDKLLGRVWNKVSRKGPTPQVPGTVLETVASETGKIAAPRAKEITQSLAGAGVRGFSKGARAFRGVGGGLGILNVGLAGMAGAQSLYNMTYGNEARAEERALKGVPMSGPGVKSVDLLRQMLAERDALARRKVVAVTHESALTQQVIQAMLGDRPTPTLTKSEMRVGAGEMPGKQEKDVSAMVEALLASMSE